MSDEPKKRLRAGVQVAIFALLAVLVAAFSIWLRASSAPDTNDVLNTAENHTPSYGPNTPPPVCEHEAVTIAIAEVKKREGLTDPVDSRIRREGRSWFVDVWPTTNPQISSPSWC
jgi:hypothetical protein